MIQLSRAIEALYERFGSMTAAPYIPGKTLFRDALCEAFDLSQADAEVLCDSLEKGGAIAFSKASETGPIWTIDRRALHDEPG